MQSHLPNKKVRVTFTIPNPTLYASGTVSVVDELQNEVYTHTMDAGDYGQTAYRIVIPETANTLDNATRGLRSVTMTLVDNDGVEYVDTQRYYLLPPAVLTVGQNSLLTFTEALMLVPELTKLDGWIGSEDSMRIAALIESYQTLGRFLLRQDIFDVSDVCELDDTGVATLDAKTLRDFQRAQMLHADYLLGGQPAKALREQGVMSHSVGESTTFFRTTKPLSYGISDRAYHYINRYLNRSVRTQRG
jgi:hypothetical protein